MLFHHSKQNYKQIVGQRIRTRFVFSTRVKKIRCDTVVFCFVSETYRASFVRLVTEFEQYSISREEKIQLEY